MVIRQGRLIGMLNLDNAGTQFEWIIVSIIPVLNKEHRNMYSACNNEKATHMIEIITLSNMKDSRGLYISKVYNLTKFDDQLSLYRQFCAYIWDKPGTSTLLHFSNNREIQDPVERRDSVFKMVIYWHERFSRCNKKKRRIETAMSQSRSKFHYIKLLHTT